MLDFSACMENCLEFRVRGPQSNFYHKKKKIFKALKKTIGIKRKEHPCLYEQRDAAVCIIELIMQNVHLDYSSTISGHPTLQQIQNTAKQLKIKSLLYNGN